MVFGYGPSALAALATFERLGVSPVAVVVPGNRQGHDVEMVIAGARERSLPLLVQPGRAASAPFLAAVHDLGPDVLFVWSYSMLLAPELIDMATKGAVNLHGGVLPEYRGGHVMNWAIINGERESAATLHYIDAGIDTGPVIAEQRFPIEWRDDITSVQARVRKTGEALLERWWPEIAHGTAPKTPQDESRARYYRMRTPDDGLVDWTQSNNQIYNLVRALTSPWPGAHTWCGAAKLVLRQVEPVVADGEPARPGTVVRCSDDEVRVACGDGDLRLLSAELEGRRADHDALRDAGLAPGVRLGQ